MYGSFQKMPILALCLSLLLTYQSRALGVENFRQVKTSSTSASTTDLRVKSYREWKSEKVQEALSRVTAVKTQIELAKCKDPNLATHRKGATEAVSGVSMERLEDQLKTEQGSLELARDLSVTDYFVGYLTKTQDKKAAFHEVAGKLTPEEVAELMAAYANSVFGGRNSEMPPSASDLSSDRVR